MVRLTKAQRRDMRDNAALGVSIASLGVGLASLVLSLDRKPSRSPTRGRRAVERRGRGPGADTTARGLTASRNSAASDNWLGAETVEDMDRQEIDQYLFTIRDICRRAEISNPKFVRLDGTPYMRFDLFDVDAVKLKAKFNFVFDREWGDFFVPLDSPYIYRRGQR